MLPALLAAPPGRGGRPGPSRGAGRGCALDWPGPRRGSQFAPGSPHPPPDSRPPALCTAIATEAEGESSGGHGEAARTRRRGGREWGRRAEERSVGGSGVGGDSEAEAGETGVSLRILCPHPSAPRGVWGVWLPGSPCVTAPSGAAAEKQQKGEANEPQLPARTPGSRGATRCGAPAAGTITRTSVARTGGPLRSRCPSPPRRHPQLRNNSCREGVRLRASEGQGRRRAPTAGLQLEPRGPGTARFPCLH